MPTFIACAKAAEIPPGKGKAVTVNQVAVAVFNLGGEFYAIANTCPHRGGPLGEGDLSGDTVTCPWHGFQFDVKTGESADGRPMRIASYPTRVASGMVEVGL